MEKSKLSDHKYRKDHELIGKACLLDGMPAIPYGCYELDEHSGRDFFEGERTLLAVIYYEGARPGLPNRSGVKAMSGVSPDNLIPLDPSSQKAREIYHTLISWLIDKKHEGFTPLTTTKRGHREPGLLA